MVVHLLLGISFEATTFRETFLTYRRKNTINQKHKNWKLFLKKTREDYVTLGKEIPDTFKGFSVMGKEAKKEGIVSEKTKEFVALGIAISTRCESCIGMHVESLIRLGTSREELIEVLAMCSYMGGGPSITFSTKALEAFEQLRK